MPHKPNLPSGTVLAVDLLSAYLANNTVAVQDVPDLIRSTRLALSEAEVPAAAPSKAPVYSAAVSVKKSLASPDHILSLIDGKPYRTLRRHLAAHGLTPEAYRARYALSPDYPMVAPEYAERRSALARQSGLGKKQALIGSAPEPEPEPVTQVRPAAPARDEDGAGEALTLNSGAGATKRAVQRRKLSIASRPVAEDAAQTRGDDKGVAMDVSSSTNRDERSGPTPAPSEPEPKPAAGKAPASPEGGSPRLTLMEAITRKRAVEALYNGAVIKLAPHQIFERHGDLFLAALNLSKNWRTDEDKRLGQFKFAGLNAVKLLDETVVPLPSYDGLLPRPDDVPILSI